MKAILALLLCAGMAQDLAPENFKVSGEAERMGRKIPLRSAFAQWAPKRSELFLFIYPYELTAADLESVRKERDFSKLKKPSPDPALWSWVPHLWIIVKFKEGSAALTREAVEARSSSLGYISFEEEGTSSTLSGSGFEFEKHIVRIDSKGISPDDVVSFEIDYPEDGAPFHRRLQVKGKATILGTFRF